MTRSTSRPGIWIGQVTRRIRDVGQSCEFFTSLGFRPIMTGEQIAILELRGGTHLLLFEDSREYKAISNNEFDLMVEDVEAIHKDLQVKRVKVSKLKQDRFHTYFEATDPDGRKWRINSDHTEGRPV